MNKFLHEPSVRLQRRRGERSGLGIVDTVRYLFALGEVPADLSTNELPTSSGTMPDAHRATEERE